MRWRETPVIGSIAAGLPLYAQQEWDGSVVVDSSIYRGSFLIELCPENPAFKPVSYAFNEISIQGKVMGVQRGPDVMAKL